MAQAPLNTRGLVNYATNFLHMNLLSSKPVNSQAVLGLVRMLTGIFMIYHGRELFESDKIDEYTKWLVDLHLPSPRSWALLGKVAELAGGILLMLGLFTRIATIFLTATMLFIIFGLGHGKIWYEDQYPFLFVLLFIIYFFNGPGAWSLDAKREKS